MIQVFAGYLPLALLIIPFFALLRLIATSKRLTRQTNRLSKMIRAFKLIDHTVEAKAQVVEPLQVSEELLYRKEYLSERAKLKHSKQRRLVKRLESITSKESE